LFFRTGLQDFSGLTGLGFNPDNPEKSCNPVKNNDSLFLDRMDRIY
jgi:hypothetical protein